MYIAFSCQIGSNWLGLLCRGNLWVSSKSIVNHFPVFLFLYACLQGLGRRFACIWKWLSFRTYWNFSTFFSKRISIDKCRQPWVGFDPDFVFSRVNLNLIWRCEVSNKSVLDWWVVQICGINLHNESGTHTLSLSRKVCLQTPDLMDMNNAWNIGTSQIQR